ncbi:hypothetical protein KSF73_05545 [Burkholderiaceae bacterium DAT-1]|nr:hypothetical protein [Burkholderiaceae bacterium DAT-1]
MLVFLVLMISSCSYKTYSPAGKFWFSFENSNKAELISLLDSFARENGFIKKQDGGEGLLPEASAVRVLAVYSEKEIYGFEVENVLSEKCYSGAAFYLGEADDGGARRVALNLQLFLKQRLGSRFVRYVDQNCKVAMR